MILSERQENSFDFLRLFAALCVTFAHSFNYSYPDYIEPLYTLTNGKLNFSNVGLYTFFSMSGFLIARSAQNSVSVWHFLWKRILRIQPLLLALCLVTVLLLGPFFTALSVSQYFSSEAAWTYFRNVFPLTGIQFTLPGVFINYSNNSINGSLWTLVVEERLYILAAIIFFLPKIGKKIWCFLTIAFNCYFIITLFAPQLFTLQFNYTFFLALLFLNSACLYTLQFDFYKYRYILIMFGFLFSAVSFLKPETAFLQTIFLPVLIIGIGYCRGFLNKAGKYGDFSYGIYVLSSPVQQMLSSIKILKENPYLQFCSTILIVFPLAVISWHFLEKRMLAYKNRFT